VSFKPFVSPKLFHTRPAIGFVLTTDDTAAIFHLQDVLPSFAQNFPKPSLKKIWRVIRDERERIEYYEDTGERSSLFNLCCIAGGGIGKNSPGHEKSS